QTQVISPDSPGRPREGIFRRGSRPARRARELLKGRDPAVWQKTGPTRNKQQLWKLQPNPSFRSRGDPDRKRPNASAKKEER
ncbi:hypothetical protein ACFFOP_28310, partial [Sinosporangium siamense]|uniref:hypothetical protein n=1 Tax=Sinosporangium siamense TaxID=1367973 RepID=UPI0035EA0DD9